MYSILTPLTRCGENKPVKGSLVRRSPQRSIGVFQKTKAFHLWSIMLPFPFFRCESWKERGLDGLSGGRATPLAEDGRQSWDSCRGYTHAPFQHGETSALKVLFSKMRPPRTVWLPFPTSSLLGTWDSSSLPFLIWGHWDMRGEISGWWIFGVLLSVYKSMYLYMFMGQRLLDWMIKSVPNCPVNKQIVQWFIGFIP